VIKQPKMSKRRYNRLKNFVYKFVFNTERAILKSRLMMSKLRQFDDDIF